MSDQPSMTAWEPPRAPTSGSRPRASFRHGVLAAVASAMTGLAIWVPTAAMQPRVDYVGDSSNISGWYFPLMLVGAVVLAAVFWQVWYLVAPAMVVPQLVLAGPTTPRGDNDGLWGLIFLLLPILAAGLFFCCAMVGVLRGWLRARS